MSLHYLLDGYNITHQISQLDHKDPSEQREILVGLIERSQPQGSSNNKVTLFFDGHPGQWNPNQPRGIKVLFSMNDSADDRIREMVSQDSNKSTMIIVTDDRSLQYAVRALGAKTLAVKDFLGKMTPSKPIFSKKSSKTSKESGSKSISSSLESEITQELADIWLKKKSTDK